MDQKQNQKNKANDLSRRRFMRDGAVAAAGVVIGLGGAGTQEAHAAKKRGDLQLQF